MWVARRKRKRKGIANTHNKRLRKKLSNCLKKLSTEKCESCTVRKVSALEPEVKKKIGTYNSILFNS